MSERPVVLVDMDGVLADFDGATETYLREHHPDIAIAPRRNFYFRHDYLEAAHQAIIEELHASQYFFQNLPEIPGALNGWQRIIDLGYEPRICSSPLHSNEWCEAEKLEWIGRQLGQAAVETAYITSEKYRCEGIALIDDRPDIKRSEEASWQHVVFSQPYNHTLETSLRLNGWDDPRLEEILTTARRRYE